MIPANTCRCVTVGGRVCPHDGPASGAGSMGRAFTGGWKGESPVARENMYQIEPNPDITR